MGNFAINLKRKISRAKIKVPRNPPSLEGGRGSNLGGIHMGGGGSHAGGGGGGVNQWAKW